MAQLGLFPPSISHSPLVLYGLVLKSKFLSVISQMSGLRLVQAQAGL